jgi:SPP1 family predicted phage head-tail adaptor
MAINPGPMRKVIRVEERSTLPDSAGEQLVNWTLVLEQRAAITRAPGREAWSASERSGRVPTEFRTRWRADVKVVPRMRLICDGSLYNIISAIDPDGMRAELVITCEELVEEPVNP